MSAVKSPIDYIQDNLIFAADKSCWAVYELCGFDYDLLSVESKLAVINRLTLFISGIVAEAKFMIIPVVQDLEAHFRRLRERLDKNPEDPLYDYAQNYLNLLKAELIETEGKSVLANDYKTFVSIKLQKDGEELDALKQFKDQLNFIIKAVFNDINALAGTDVKDIPAGKVREYKKLAKSIRRDQTRRIELNAADDAVLSWLLQRNMFRGLPEDGQLYTKRLKKRRKLSSEDVELAGEKFLRPRPREIVNLFSGNIFEQGRSLIVKHNKTASYQTFLTITAIPDELQVPDNEWIYMLQQMNAGAEMYIHIKNTEHRKAIKKIEDKRREANSQIENIEKAAAEVPQDLWNSKDEIEELEAELKANRAPLPSVSVTICVTADNEEELNDKATFIIQEYKDFNFSIERSLCDQYDLFMHCLPCVTFTVSDFVMKLTPRTLASGVIGATRELGDNVGYYIGTTGTERKPVFLDLGLACRSNMSASATYYGNLGVGKSFNANLLTLLHVIFGGYGLIIDPKGERTHWLDKMTFLTEKGLISLVTLSANEKYRGMLDPFNIFKGDMSEACELALNVISELFKLNPKDDEYTALLESIEAIKHGDITRPSIIKLAEILDKFSPKDQLYKPAKMLARRINLLKHSGMAQLFIGNGTEKAITLDNRLNILQIQNIKLPDKSADRDNYTQEEIVSTVLMMVIAAFTRRFVHSHEGSFKVALFDESWMLGKTTEGEKLMSYVARMSRSLYSSLILNGHSVTDLPNEGIKNTITYKFCFKTGSVDEARRMLEFLKLEETAENINTITNLGNAQCLFQDLNGRSGVLQFDAVFEDLISIFSTTPTDKADLKKIDETPPAKSQEPKPDETEKPAADETDIDDDEQDELDYGYLRELEGKEAITA